MLMVLLLFSSHFHCPSYGPCQSPSGNDHCPTCSPCMSPSDDDFLDGSSCSSCSSCSSPCSFYSSPRSCPSPCSPAVFISHHPALVCPPMVPYPCYHELRRLRFMTLDVGKHNVSLPSPLSFKRGRFRPLVAPQHTYLNACSAVHSIKDWHRTSGPSSIVPHCPS
ncbi:MAG: hypothetical protein J3Q66DRAFT_189738 [Benniella sp.]|nr:MAG: hypothetical protein J3Q66DRAFT_189738 [Benniella sp.]